MNHLVAIAGEVLLDELEAYRERLQCQALWCVVTSPRRPQGTLFRCDPQKFVRPDADELLVARTVQAARSLESDAFDVGNKYAFSVGLSSWAGDVHVGLTALEPSVLPDDLLRADELGRVLPWAVLIADPSTNMRAFSAEAETAPSPLAYLAALTSQTKSDAAMIWSLEPPSEKAKVKVRMMTAMQSWGCRASTDRFTVPQGRGIIGRLNAGADVVAWNLATSDTYNPVLVNSEGWKRCIAAPLSGGGRLLGAISIYSRSGWSDEKAEIERIERSLPSCLPQLRRLRKWNDLERRNKEMEARLERLQVGVELLGFAHDLVGSASEVSDRADMLARHLRGRLSDKTSEALLNELKSKSRLVYTATRAMNRLAEKRKDEITTFDIAPALEEVKIILRAISPYVSLEVEGGMLSRGHPLDIQRIVINLVSNSRHWVPDADQHIKVKGQRIHKDSGDVAEIRVEDRGQGMSQEQIRKATSLMYSTREDGLGLGLYIVKRLVEHLGGELRIYSKQYAWTTVVVRLPLLPVKGS